MSKNARMSDSVAWINLILGAIGITILLVVLLTFVLRTELFAYPGSLIVRICLAELAVLIYFAIASSVSLWKPEDYHNEAFICKHLTILNLPAYVIGTLYQLCLSHTVVNTIRVPFSDTRKLLAYYDVISCVVLIVLTTAHYLSGAYLITDTGYCYLDSVYSWFDYVGYMIPLIVFVAMSVALVYIISMLKMMGRTKSLFDNYLTRYALYIASYLLTNFCLAYMMLIFIASEKSKRVSDREVAIFVASSGCIYPVLLGIIRLTDPVVRVAFTRAKAYSVADLLEEMGMNLARPSIIYHGEEGEVCPAQLFLDTEGSVSQHQTSSTGEEDDEESFYSTARNLRRVDSRLSSNSQQQMTPTSRAQPYSRKGSKPVPYAEKMINKLSKVESLRRTLMTIMAGVRGFDGLRKGNDPLSCGDCKNTLFSNVYYTEIKRFEIGEDRTRTLFGSHWGEALKIKLYAPRIFRDLYRKGGIDEDTIWNSLNPAFNVEFITNINTQGGSGSFFFFSHDRRFVLKTITKLEKNTLLEKVLPKYHNHVSEHPHSFISLMFGVYKIYLRYQKAIYILMQENVHQYDDVDVRAVYDIKGSTHDRCVEKEIGAEAITPSTVLKDLDFTQRQGALRCSLREREMVMLQLTRDINLFKSIGIMDYSLSIRVFEVDSDPVTSGASRPSGLLNKNLFRDCEFEHKICIDRSLCPTCNCMWSKYSTNPDILGEVIDDFKDRTCSISSSEKFPAKLNRFFSPKKKALLEKRRRFMKTACERSSSSQVHRSSNMIDGSPSSEFRISLLKGEEVINSLSESELVSNQQNQQVSIDGFDYSVAPNAHRLFKAEENGSSDSKQLFFSIGIIDYLQMYSSLKKLEKHAKYLRSMSNKIDLSSQNPKVYASRFLDFAQQIFAVEQKQFRAPPTKRLLSPPHEFVLAKTFSEIVEEKKQRGSRSEYDHLLRDPSSDSVSPVEEIKLEASNDYDYEGFSSRLND